MKNAHRFIGIVLLLLACFPVIAQSAEEQKTYNVGVLDFPPFYIVKDSNNVEGIISDLLRKILNNEGIPYVLRGFPPKRLYQNLAEGKTDIFVGIKGVPQYEDKVIFSESPIVDIDLRVYARNDTPILKTKEELKGKTILNISGYGYGGFVKYLEDPANNITLDPCSDHLSAFRKLKVKRADYVLDYRRPASDALKQVDIPDIQSNSILKIDTFFIISKKTPGGEELMKRLEKAYFAIPKEERP